MKSFVKSLLGQGGKVAPAETPRVEAGHRVYCIGDIHGRLDLLQELHGMIGSDADGSDADCSVVYLGDCIDRGMQSRQVIDELLGEPLPGMNSVYLAGNHEQTLLDFLEHPEAASGWLTWGGRETLASYGVNLPPHERPDPESIRDRFQVQLPDRHLEFYRDMQLMHTSGDYLFVHAGIRPGKPIQEQNKADLLWIRNEFTQSREQHGCVVVHGHTISDEVAFHPNRIGIDTGAFYTGVLTCLVLEGAEQRLLQTGVEG